MKFNILKAGNSRLQDFINQGQDNQKRSLANKFTIMIYCAWCMVNFILYNVSLAGIKDRTIYI